MTVLASCRSTLLFVTIHTVQVVDGFQARDVHMVFLYMLFLFLEGTGRKRFIRMASTASDDTRNIVTIVASSTPLSAVGCACGVVMAHGTIIDDLDVHEMLEFHAFIKNNQGVQYDAFRYIKITAMNNCCTQEGYCQNACKNKIVSCYHDPLLSFPDDAGSVHTS
jgi:hypothetical protein